MAEAGNSAGHTPWSQHHQASAVSKTDKDSQWNPNDSTYAQLKEYETRRRLAHSSKYDSMSLYWKSYRDLLSAALSETARAQRLVLGTCRAHEVYAAAMAAIHDDVFLDEKGNVTNEKKQKSLLSSRKQKQKASNLDEKSVMIEIRAAQKVSADKFGENAKNMDEEIAEAIGAMLEDLKIQVSTMDDLGSSVLSELEKTESELSILWNRYLSRADPSTPNSTEESAPTSEVYDKWIAETQYRVAVAYQNEAWNKGSSQLDKLFRQVKEEEILRRMNLREFLVAFVQRQQRLFLSLPSIHNSVLEELVGKETSREEIEESIRSTIPNKTNEIGLSSVKGPSLQSPLTSDLLSKAKVIERRSLSVGVSSIGNIPDWKVSLAIMTADSYLHFFDMDDPRISSSSTAEAAFEVLMPTVIVPTVESLLVGKSNFSKGWSESLAPTESIVLAKCILQNEEENSFTIIERGGGATAASKMFGKLIDKKIHVRTQEKDDKDDWMSILTS